MRPTIPALLPALSLGLALAALPAAAGTLLVANKSDASVDLIDLATGESRATLPTGKGPHEAAVSPDGAVAVVSDYGTREAPGSTLTVIDVAAGALLRTVDLGRHTRPHGLAWIDGRRLAVTAEGSRHLLVVNPRSGTVEAEIATGQEVSHMVAVTPDGKRAFVANIGSGSVTAVDLEKREKLADVATGAGAEGIAVTPDGGEVWVTNRAADTLSVIDPGTLEVKATLPCPSFPIRVAITPDGERALVSAAESGEVVAFDVASRREVGRRKLDLANAPDAARRLFGDQFGDSPVPVGLLVAPGGGKAWVAATQADAVVVVSTGDLKVLDVIRAGREPDGLAVSAK